MTNPTNDCQGCVRLRSELLDVGVAAGVYHEADYGKHLAPTPAVVRGIDAMAKKAEEIDEAVIFMRTRGFVGPMLAMCKHVLRELDALDKAKNELIDERDQLLRDMRVLVLARDEAKKERNDFLDCCRAMLVAAGAPEDIDAMEDVVRSAGSKPSDYIKHVVGELRDEVRRLSCGSQYFSIGHQRHVVCQLPSGHVGVHSMAWGNNSCQWNEGVR